MDAANKEFFRKLITAPGPSGFEQAPTKVWREAASELAESLDWDNLGNSYAFVNGTAGSDYAVVIEGHIDVTLFILHSLKEGCVTSGRRSRSCFECLHVQ